MKRGSTLLPASKASLLSVLPVLLMLAGCAQTLRLKVVDAAGRQSLDGVRMTWIRVRPGLLKDFGSETVERLLPKASDGVSIRDVSVSKGGGHTFTFTKPGYQKATLVYHHGKGFIDSPDFVKPGEVVRRTSIELTNPIVVPLHRLGGGDQ